MKLLLVYNLEMLLMCADELQQISMMPWLYVRWQRDQSTIPNRSRAKPPHWPWGPKQRPIQRVPGVVSSRVRWPRHEADHSPPSNAEVKDVWSYNSDGYTNFSSKQATSTFPTANPSQFCFLTDWILLSKLPFDYHILQNSAVQCVVLQPCMWGGSRFISQQWERLLSDISR